MLPRGSAIGFISSAAGLGWEANLELLKELLVTPDVETGAKWFHDNGKDDYFHTKQAVCEYVSAQAHPMLTRGIRINAICPGTTDPPLAQANGELSLTTRTHYTPDVSLNTPTPPTSKST